MHTLYLVTGAAGHLGGTVVRELVARGDAVRALVLPGEPNPPEKPVELCYGDVCDRNSLDAFFQNPQHDQLIVIHCAGIVSIASRTIPKVQEVNVAGTKNIVDLCLEHHVHKLVHVSSVHAIPERPKPACIGETSVFDPNMVVGQYAKTKAEATAYVLDAVEKGLDASVVQPSGISGPYDRGRGHLTTLVIDYCRHRLTAGIRGGYDFVDVRDVAEGILACCEKGRPGQCYILSNRYCSVPEILGMLHNITGKKEVKTFLPLWFAKLTAPLAELYYRILRQPPLYTAYSIYTLNTNASFTHAKATKELGYHPRDLRQTLNDTVSWLKSQGRIS